MYSGGEGRGGGGGTCKINQEKYTVEEEEVK